MLMVLGVILFFASAVAFFVTFFSAALTGNHYILLVPVMLFLGSIYCIWKATWGGG